MTLSEFFQHNPGAGVRLFEAAEKLLDRLIAEGSGRQATWDAIDKATNVILDIRDGLCSDLGK